MSIKRLFVPIDIAKTALMHRFQQDCLGYWYEGDLYITDRAGRDTTCFKIRDQFGLAGNAQGFLAPTHIQLVEWFANKGINIPVVILPYHMPDQYEILNDAIRDAFKRLDKYNK